MSSSRRHILSYCKFILKRLRINEKVMFKKLNKLHTEVMGFNRSIEFRGCQHKYSWRLRLCGRSFKVS